MKPKPLAVLLSAIAVTSWLCWPASPPASSSKVAAAVPRADHADHAEPQAPAESIDLALAMEQKSVVAEFLGNGRDQFRVALLNKGAAPLRVTVAMGQMFESDLAAPVVVTQPGALEIGPARTGELRLQTAATRSSNKPLTQGWRLSYATLPRVSELLVKAQAHPEMTLGAVQTALLSMTENLPLSAVAKFTLAASPLPSRFNTDAYRVETIDLVNALSLLREMQIPDSTLALTIDPQLRIEAMIDPSARPLAMRYYAIAPAQEWEFWRSELLNGEPSTRHYALYGIARFYPDVALQMLPRWARETRTNPVYRLAAVQALADTERAEALPILRALGKEMGAFSELGIAAAGAADYLDYQLAQTQAARNAVAFHVSTGARAAEQKLVVASN